MKKKHRIIIVDNIPYAWTYQPNDDRYEGGGELKIWKNKKVIHKRVVDSEEIITPLYLAELITLIEDYGDVE